MAKDDYNDMVPLWTTEQINLIGSSYVYNKLNENMKCLKFDKFLVKEQFLLYQWREDFFIRNFGWERDTWYTWGGDDYRAKSCFDTIPYQVVMNFDEVMNYANKLKTGKQDELRKEMMENYYNEEIFFACSEEASNSIRNRYDANMIEFNFDQDVFSEDHFGLTESKAICFTVVMYQTTPMSLKTLAIKAAINFDLNTERLPTSLNTYLKTFTQDTFHFDTVSQSLNAKGHDILSNILGTMYMPKNESESIANEEVSDEFYLCEESDSDYELVNESDSDKDATSSEDKCTT